MNDLKFAFRQLLKNPGFTAVAVFTLALGIGTCTAMFSIVNSVLLRPLPYPESDRIVAIQETKLPQFPQFAVSPANYLDWRTEATSFEQLAAVRSASFNLTGMGEPVRIAANRVTPNYLTVFGSRPTLGRDFTEDEVVARANVVLLSHGFWLRQFGGRTNVLGDPIQLDGQTFTIIGVLSKDFRPSDGPEIYTPLSYDEDSKNRGSKGLFVVGRLKEGIALDQARSELALIAGRLAQQYPDSNKGWSTKLTQLLELNVANMRLTLFALLGAVGFLLLIASANIANLLLTRAVDRAKEIAIRTALGAGRARIVRQLATESLLLAFVGGAFGVVLANWGMKSLLAFAPGNLPRFGEIALDGRALGFSFAVTLLTGIGFGLMPAFHASRSDFNKALKDGGRGTSGGGQRQRARNTLVVMEVALATLLLVGSGLLIRSFNRLQNVDPGFRPHEAVAAHLSLSRQKYGSDPKQAAFAEEVLGRLAVLPGVQSVAAANMLPLSGADLIYLFDIVGRPAPASDPNTLQSAIFYSVTPDYFKAAGISIVRGRSFTPADRVGAPQVALISESLAEKYFPGENPVGQHLNLASGAAEVVGVVADVKHRQLDESTTIQTYVPFAQVPFGEMTFVVRVSGRPAGLPSAIRASIHAVDPDQPIESVFPLHDLLATSVARQQFGMFLFAVFSGLALLLASIGIHGVIAYSVRQRTGEIGIRLALGAQRGHVLRMILLQGGRLVALGLVVGLLGGLVLTRLLSAMLFGISAHDPMTFATVALVLTGVAIFACWLPAHRAAKVDPMEALRTE